MKSLLAVFLSALALATAVHLWFPVTTSQEVSRPALSEAQVREVIAGAVAAQAAALVDPAASTINVSSTGQGPVALQLPPEQLAPVALQMAEQGLNVQWPESRVFTGTSVQETSILLSTIKWVLTSLLLGIALYCLISLVVRWKSGERFRRPAQGVAVIPDARFADVAGADEAVDQLSEIVAHLKDPDSLLALGVKPPRGALLVGPPGTGKTLLARAVAGEADAAFFEAAGSDFMEKLVGVGASRVRELFQAAAKHPRAIVFIDEIDAIGGVRQTPDSLGSSESDHTLVALLSELDGFTDRGNIVVIAATNRPDILDPALTRPGRLDRRIEVPLPDRRGREGILAVHARDVPLAEDADLSLIARRTPGFSGAQLEKVLQEAALRAHRAGRETIAGCDLDEAVAVVVLGVPRTSAVVTDHDRTVTAWHEAGHTLAALLLPDAPKPAAVSIIPRGSAGGATWMTETDSAFFTRREAHARMTVMMSGQAAEKILLKGDFTQGASHDLSRATEFAEAMVSSFGMSESIPSVRRPRRDGSWSPEVQVEVDGLVAAARDAANALLTAHEAALRSLARLLLDQESMGEAEIAEFAARHSLLPPTRSPRRAASSATLPRPALSYGTPAAHSTLSKGRRARIRSAIAARIRRPRPGSSFTA